MLSEIPKKPTLAESILKSPASGNTNGGSADWDNLVVVGLEALYAAHDIRNIFAAVVLRLDRLRLARTADVARHADTLQRALDQASGIHEEFIQLGRNKQPVSQANGVKISDLLERCIALLPPEQADRCRYAAPGDLRISGAVTALFRALFNIVHNASRYGETEIQVQVVPQGLAVRITDDGPGLPTAIAADPFQGHRSSASGSGNGLAIAQHLSHALGGELDLVETGDNGSTFALHVPKGSRVAFWYHSPIE